MALGCPGGSVEGGGDLVGGAAAGLADCPRRTRGSCCVRRPLGRAWTMWYAHVAQAPNRARGKGPFASITIVAVLAHISGTAGTSRLRTGTRAGHPAPGSVTKALPDGKLSQASMDPAMRGAGTARSSRMRCWRSRRRRRLLVVLRLSGWRDADQDDEVDDDRGHEDDQNGTSTSLGSEGPAASSPQRAIAIVPASDAHNAVSRLGSHSRARRWKPLAIRETMVMPTAASGVVHSIRSMSGGTTRATAAATSQTPMRMVMIRGSWLKPTQRSMPLPAILGSPAAKKKSARRPWDPERGIEQRTSSSL
jgi:hypothetical protein